MSPVLFQSFPQKHQNRSINFQYKINPCRIPETAATGGVLWKKILLKISEISQENAWRPATLLKRDFNTGAFLWNL